MINTDGFTGFGQKHSNKWTGEDYTTITLQEIYTMALNPPSVDKDNAQWVLFSTEHGGLARNLDYQLGSEGVVNCLWLDFDKGGETTETIAQALHTITGGAWFLLYHTRSSTAAHNKHRAIIPLLHPVPTLAYKAYSTALNNLAEQYGLQPDRITQTVTQLCYLPNRGEHYPTPYANDGPRWDIDPQGAMALEVRTEHAAYMKLMEDRRQQQARFAEQGGKVEGDHSFHAAFREEHPSEEILALYGFTTLNGIDWKHPEHEGNSYSTRLLPDGALYTLSSTVGAWGGVQAGEGWYMQDGFDLYVHFTCNGDRGMGETYARSLVPTVEAKLWSAPGNTLIQNALADHQRTVAIQNAAADAIQQELRNRVVELEADVTQNAANWDVPEIPEGLMRDLYHGVLNRSLLPVPQFTLASLIHVFGALLGDRYHQDVGGDGIITYMMLVADTGLGKTDSLNTVKKILGEVAYEAQYPDIVSVIAQNDIPISAPGVHSALLTSNRLAFFRDDAASLMDKMMTQDSGLEQMTRDKIMTCWSENNRIGHLPKMTASKSDNTKGGVDRPALSAGFGLQLSAFRRLLSANGAAALGFLNRFFIAKYDGPEQYKRFDAMERPADPVLLQKLAAMVRHVQQLTTDVPIKVDPAVTQARRDYDNEQVDRRNTHYSQYQQSDTAMQSIARLPQQVMRLAGFVAVMNDYVNPCITLADFNWARAVFEMSAAQLTEEYGQGAADGADEALRNSMLSFMEHYFSKSDNDRHLQFKAPKYVLGPGMNVYIPQSILFKGSANRGAFRNHKHKLSEERTLTDTVMQLVSRDIIVPITSAELKVRHPLLKHTGKQNVYTFGPEHPLYAGGG